MNIEAIITGLVIVILTCIVAIYFYYNVTHKPTKEERFMENELQQQLERDKIKEQVLA